MIHFIGGDLKIAAVDLSKVSCVGPRLLVDHHGHPMPEFTLYVHGVSEGIKIKGQEAWKYREELLAALSEYKLICEEPTK
ncbi:hypothetical protein [Enterobacter sp.]|uniref:hypothetical protein n=1 Tax=Enterobacter sp. TaxID=42895 RepID=UPI00296F0D34|nr:hypothetical protein [Enterobacter sp.]